MNIKLSEYSNPNPTDDRYELDPTQKYVLMDFESELKIQSSILMSFQINPLCPLDFVIMYKHQGRILLCIIYLIYNLFTHRLRGAEN